MIDHAIVAVQGEAGGVVCPQFFLEDDVFSAPCPPGKTQKIPAPERTAVGRGGTKKMSFLGIVFEILKGGDAFGRGHDLCQKEKISVRWSGSSAGLRP